MSEDAQARIGSLALNALDDIEELYGEDCEVLDAVLLFEVLVPGEDGEQDSIIHRVATSNRVAVINGIIDLAHSAVNQTVDD